MILLDTNVLSALMRHERDPIVVAWLDDQPPDAIWTTTITTFEIRDVQIAGITTARKATRNIRHFVGTGISTTNPWSE
jgi:predicted nucleic acid-binding protein